MGSTLTYAGSFWTVTVEQMTETVSTSGPTLDTQWRATDPAGHAHYYDHGYPTLDYIVDASHECDGTEGFMHHDPHTHVDASHYECLICREVVEPGIASPGSWDVPTWRSAKLEGRRSDGLVVEILLTPTECRSLIEDAATTDTTALAIMDGAELARCLSVQYEGT